MIKLILQVCLVTMYSKKQIKNLLYLKKCNIKPKFIKVFFLFMRTSMELFPGRQLNVMQSVIVANGKGRLVLILGNFSGLIL